MKKSRKFVVNLENPVILIDDVSSRKYNLNMQFSVKKVKTILENKKIK